MCITFKWFWFFCSFGLEIVKQLIRNMILWLISLVWASERFLYFFLLFIQFKVYSCVVLIVCSVNNIIQSTNKIKYAKIKTLLVLCACVLQSPWPRFFFALHAGSYQLLLSVMAARVLQQCVRSLARPSLRLSSGSLAVRAAAAPAAAVHRPLSFAADSRRTRWLGQSRVSLR